MYIAALRITTIPALVALTPDIYRQRSELACANPERPAVKARIIILPEHRIRSSGAPSQVIDTLIRRIRIIDMHNYQCQP